MQLQINVYVKSLAEKLYLRKIVKKLLLWLLSTFLSRDTDLRLFLVLNVAEIE